MTTSVGVGMGADVGFGILQAANNNKIRLALAAANTFFIFMFDFLLFVHGFGATQILLCQRSMACLFIIYKTLPNRIHQLGSVSLVHLGEGFLDIFLIDSRW
jgi:hypothetical protein